MGHQPDREPKGKAPKTIYLCDRTKECNRHWDCGQLCKHTTDINHAVNFINLGCGNYVEKAPTVEAIPTEWILNNERMPKDGKGHDAIMDMIADWRKEHAETN